MNELDKAVKRRDNALKVLETLEARFNRKTSPRFWIDEAEYTAKAEHWAIEAALWQVEVLKLEVENCDHSTQREYCTCEMYGDCFCGAEDTCGKCGKTLEAI